MGGASGRSEPSFSPSRVSSPDQVVGVVCVFLGAKIAPVSRRSCGGQQKPLPQEQASLWLRPFSTVLVIKWLFISSASLVTFAVKEQSAQTKAVGPSLYSDGQALLQLLPHLEWWEAPGRSKPQAFFDACPSSPLGCGPAGSGQGQMGWRAGSAAANGPRQ